MKNWKEVSEMARPSKSVNTISKNLTKEERAARLEAEEKLRGDNSKLTPPEYLTATQQEIYLFIIGQLKASNILGNIDTYVLESCVIAIDRMREIEALINNDPKMMLDKDVMRARKDYRDTFFRCCNELSLSPQSRAKIGIINVQKKEQDGDELLKVLRGGKG